MILRKIAFVFFFSFLQGSAFALVGLGAYVPYASKWQVDRRGGDNLTRFTPFVELNHYFFFNDEHAFRPALGYVYMPQVQQSYRKFFFYLHQNMLYLLNRSFAFTYGLGEFVTILQGSGGVVTLKNGNGVMQFDNPSEVRGFVNVGLNGGLEFFFDPHLSLQGMSSWFAILDGEKRSVHYSLSLHYFF